MKIAIVQDGLMCRAGAEQVALCFHKAFPEAPIYTQCYQPGLTFSEFKNCDIRTTWLQRVAKTDNTMKRLFFPLGIWAMKSHDLTAFDVVLISSTHSGKYIKLSSSALVINYCHTPFRLVWDPTSYAQYVRSTKLKRFLFDSAINIMRSVDFKAAQRPDYYIANTKETAQRIATFYQINKSIEVIYPPVNASKFYVSNRPKRYFLVVSRLEYYKKVDLVVEAFNQLGYPLIIVGKGVQADEIIESANSNITFMSGLSTQELADVYAGCRAFLFPQHEDYGITPLEANSAGRPVIAYGEGGVLATQIPVFDDPSCATALFFDNQTVEDLIKAVKQFEVIEHRFIPSFIRKHAESFDEPIFIHKIKQFVAEKYLQHIGESFDSVF
ncbi:glycosyltransferase [Spirosoma jeollabukense]